MKPAGAGEQRHGRLGSGETKTLINRQCVTVFGSVVSSSSSRPPPLSTCARSALRIELTDLSWIRPYDGLVVGQVVRGSPREVKSSQGRVVGSGSRSGRRTPSEAETRAERASERQQSHRNSSEGGKVKRIRSRFTDNAAFIVRSTQSSHLGHSSSTSKARRPSITMTADAQVAITSCCHSALARWLGSQGTGPRSG